MKKHYLILLTVIMTLLLISCASENTKNEIGENIELNKITKITVSTQMTESKQDVVLKEEKWKELVNKLNAFSLTETSQEKQKGWQYLFKIEQDGNITLISFSDNKVTVGETVYEVKNYDPNEFLYLFE